MSDAKLKSGCWRVGEGRVRAPLNPKADDEPVATDTVETKDSEEPVADNRWGGGDCGDDGS